MFNELVNEISKDIQKHEQRSRLRTTEEQFTKSRQRFNYKKIDIGITIWDIALC